MVSFDMSTTNIVLTAAVVGLFVFFIALLMKLNPSTEKKEKLESKGEAERQKPMQTPITVPQSSVTQRQPPPQPAKVEDQRVEVPRVYEKPLVAVGPTVGGASVQAKQTTPTPPPTLSQSQEHSKPQEKIVAPAQPQANTLGVPSRRDCLHQFGYLRTFPKNAPIPDECFGCERIVDCLVNNKKSNAKNERWRWR